MPMFYDVTRSITTNGSGGTLSTHLRALTVTQQPTMSLMNVYGSMRSGTAGGAQVRVVTSGATIGSGGTSQTPAKKNANNAAAQTTWFNDATAITPGTTPTTRFTVGLAQTGGMGGWAPIQPDEAIQLLANGGNNGNLEVGSLANATSVAGDLTVGFSEM